MDERFIIELLEDLTDSQDNEQKQDALLKRCLKASDSDLEEFFEDLSQLFVHSPDTYLLALKTFTSHVRIKFSQDAPILNLHARCNATLSNFFSKLITVVMLKNLHHSDISSFGEFLRSCIELLWSINKRLASQIMKQIFNAILIDDSLKVFVSGASGRRCLRCILFDFNIVKQIERDELLKAVDMAVTLVEKCPEHKEIMPQISRSLSIYEACTALLKALNSIEQTPLADGKGSLPILSDMIVLNKKEPRMQHWSRRKVIKSNLITISLSEEDRQYFVLLEMEIPQKRSDLPNYLRALEQRKIDLFQDLMNILSHASYFLKEESTPSDRVFRLPFEFSDGDKLGPWDILLSEDTINDMRRLKSPLVVKKVMRKLGRVSSGKWGKHDLQCIAWNKHGIQHIDAIPVYEIELPDDGGLRILWQIDYGFSIRSRSITQLVKVWTVTANDEQIRKILENLSIVHKVYTSKQSGWCIVEQLGKDDVISPKRYDGEEETKSSEENLHSSHGIDDERLLEVHKMQFLLQHESSISGKDDVP